MTTTALARYFRIHLEQLAARYQHQAAETAAHIDAFDDAALGCCQVAITRGPDAARTHIDTLRQIHQLWTGLAADVDRYLTDPPTDEDSDQLVIFP